jgi:voltage-gated potassium channel
MDFLRHVVTASILILLTLGTQSAGMGALIHWGRAQFRRELHRLGPLRSAALIVRCMIVMIAFHLLQILLWAGFYRWNCFPSWESAFYFSAASFSTVGCGDLILPPAWRTLGPVESVAGVLMCGLSASFLFAIVNRLVEREQLAVPVTQIDS